MKKILALLCCLTAVCLFGAQAGAETSMEEEINMFMRIGDRVLTVQMAENSTVQALFELLSDGPLTLENCTLIGTQPLCYCKNLRLIHCKMIDADLAFEKSDVEATLTAPIVSVKNPRSGHIQAPAVGELIMDDPEARGMVKVVREGECA